MTNMLTTRLVKIGNSQGVLIPKILLEQVGFVMKFKSSWRRISW